MNFLHYEFQLKKGDVVEVKLDKQANVQLLDELNFNNYKKGKKYSQIGGLSKKLIINLTSPYKGHWHLVIDLGGHAGTVKASVQVNKP
ncbi:MAG: DUF1883 domain-containing protein [Spirochaetaceae bacterium]|nr:DUF1883 domain-containing protein [Spirochaetaceae bacterium]